jgi:hypothetical protein
MIYVKNVKPSVVVLNGSIVVAPLDVVQVDENDNGVKRLLENGQLVEATSNEIPTTVEEQPEVGGMTVAELKEYLKAKGVQFDANAKKDELLTLAKEA